MPRKYIVPLAKNNKMTRLAAATFAALLILLMTAGAASAYSCTATVSNSTGTDIRVFGSGEADPVCINITINNASESSITENGVWLLKKPLYLNSSGVTFYANSTQINTWQLYSNATNSSWADIYSPYDDGGIVKIDNIIIESWNSTENDFYDMYKHDNNIQRAGLTIGGNSSTIYNSTLRYLGSDPDNVWGDVNYGLTLNGCNYCIVDNVTIHHNPYGIKLQQLTGTDNNVISNVTIYNSFWDGLSAYATNNNTIKDAVIYNSSRRDIGVFLGDAGDTIYFTNVTIESPRFNGEPGQGATEGPGFVVDDLVTIVTVNGLTVNDSSVSIAGNNGTYNDIRVSNRSDVAIKLTSGASNSKNNTFTNITVTSSNQAIQFANSDDNHVSNLTYHTTVSWAAKYWSGSRNWINNSNISGGVYAVYVTGSGTGGGTYNTAAKGGGGWQTYTSDATSASTFQIINPVLNGSLVVDSNVAGNNFSIVFDKGNLTNLGNLFNIYNNGANITVDNTETTISTIYNIAIKPSQNNVTATNTSSNIAIDQRNNTIPYIYTNLSTPVPQMNISISNVSQNTNLSLRYASNDSEIAYYVVGANLTAYFNNSLGNDNYNITEASQGAPATFIPSTPTTLANTTGSYWVNHTWSAGAGNITDSFNVSVNGTWHNGTTNTYWNNSGLQSGSWSNITVFAWNNSGTGTLSLAGASMNTQAPSAPAPTPTPEATATATTWTSLKNDTSIWEVLGGVFKASAIISVVVHIIGAAKGKIQKIDAIIGITVSIFIMVVVYIIIPIIGSTIGQI